MKLLSVVSARPNFVKLAGLHHAILRGSGIGHVIVHTGQHYDPLLFDIFFKQLKIPQPDANLGVHSVERMEMIEQTAQSLLPVLEREKPDWVLVYGDVNGALGAARAAKECSIRLAHVEAGLRSRDMEMPEEHNRIGIDKIADLLFCTEQSGVDNLRGERVLGAAHLVGNTMIDTLLRMMPLIKNQPHIDALMGCTSFILTTLHRPSNVDTDEALRRNIDFLTELAQTSTYPVLLPSHHRLKAAFTRCGLPPSGDIRWVNERNMRVVDAFGYLQFIRLMQLSSFVVTDSGGIQEEAVLLKKRCFTLRKNTERPVTIACGSNVLVDLEKPADRANVLEYAANPVPPQVRIPEFWDGKAGERIVEMLMRA